MISPSRLPFLLKLGVATFLSAAFSILFLSNRPVSHYRYIIGHRPSFLEIAQDTQIDNPYDLTPLKELCASSKWTEGIIFSCGFPSGEIAEVRNTILNCLRYAIAAGAALVIPEIYVLLEDVKTNKTIARAESFTHYFDLAHFITSLTEFCPQMTLYRTMDDLWEFPTVSKPINLDPTTLFSSFKLDTLDSNPSEWSNNFHHWLQKTQPEYTPTLPAFVRVREPFLNFPTDHDSPEFVSSYGRILQYRSDIRRLAAQIHLELSQFIPSLRAGTSIRNDTYLGAHLRKMTHDSPPGLTTDWTSLATQAKLYANTATTYNLRTIYVAATRVGDISAIKGLANEQGLHIVSKETLLARGALDGLTWDQKAIVDFEVLLRGGGFVGVTWSLFAWSVAMRRHTVCGDEVEVKLEDGRNTTGHDLGFGDGCSRLFGERDETFRWGVWP